MFRLARHRYYFLLLLMSPALCALAQDTQPLHVSMALQERLPPSVRKLTPLFIFGNSITGRTDLDMAIDGNAELRKSETVIKANRMDYNQATDIAKVSGDVVINQGGNRFSGKDLELNVTDFSGFFNEPHFQFYKTGGEGSAKQFEFVNERMAIATLATYSTCRRPESIDGKAWKPDWIFTADQLKFDMEQDVATASGSVLRFKDVPILALPEITFPMSSARKSGALAPTIASDNISGLIVTQPIYWNIAPNRDATFYPTLIANRGMDFGGEFRYLEPNSTGTLRADYLPHDKLYGDKRWGFAVDQRNLIKTPFVNSTDVLANIRLNRVSDNRYWRDFPNNNASLTQRLLNNELNTTSTLNGWATQFRIQRWQTLQDATNPITPPFDRTQLNTKRSFDWGSGLRAQFDGDITAFKSDAALTAQPNGVRMYGNAQIARPWVTPAGFVTPKLSFNASGYQLTSPVGGFNDTTLQRYTPTVSLDSGLFFERDSKLFGRAFMQTLEPRIYYVRTPYHDQTRLPNYDSGEKDFSLTTIYSENPFVGNDRIADVNRLTMGISSKFIDPSSGAQALNVGLAQRLSFSDQRVTLPGVAPAGRVSDMLASANVQLYPAWAIDSTVQFGNSGGAAEKATISTRFTPSNYRSVSAAYRLQHGISEQLDIGWQWPLGDLLPKQEPTPNHWYSVARFNYSMFDKRLVNAIAGVEYDADCWIGRIVFEKTQLDVNTTNQRIMFQIEFTGFARVGISPLASLRSNIPRYQNLREQISSPSRFSQYD